MSRPFLKHVNPIPVAEFSAISLFAAMNTIRSAESPEAVAASLETVAYYLKNGMFAVRPSLAESSDPHAVKLVLELAYAADV